jgi:hemoglobin-like flavoprotein
MSLNVELLENSFQLIKPQAEEFATKFYDNLLTDYPEVQPLFAHTDLTKQRKHLISALVLVVENLRRPESLKEALTSLGVRHVNYGTIPEYYPFVGQTLLKTFEQVLQTNWTPEIKQAWVDAYEVISQVMLTGAATS